jgi:hypothetical protein
MAVVLFDTHAFVKRLTAVGMPEAQAEVLVDQQAQLIEERLATKSDLAALATKVELRELELRLENKIESVKSEIVRGMFGTIGFQTVIILGAVVALSRTFH